jgi:hypothetical protein
LPLPALRVAALMTPLNVVIASFPGAAHQRA